jgi:hypothetical protein
VKSNYITIQTAYTFSTYVVAVNSQYDGRAQLFMLLIPEQVVFISCHPKRHLNDILPQQEDVLNDIFTPCEQFLSIVTNCFP